MLARRLQACIASMMKFPEILVQCKKCWQIHLDQTNFTVAKVQRTPWPSDLVIFVDDITENMRFMGLLSAASSKEAAHAKILCWSVRPETCPNEMFFTYQGFRVSSWNLLLDLDLIHQDLQNYSEPWALTSKQSTPIPLGTAKELEESEPANIPSRMQKFTYSMFYIQWSLPALPKNPQTKTPPSAAGQSIPWRFARPLRHLDLLGWPGRAKGAKRWGFCCFRSASPR